MIVDSFPTTANGKLDRNSLPTPTVYAVPEKRRCFEESKCGVQIAQPYLNSELTMANHICNVVQKVRGYHPRPSATLAAIGIDSLGSVLFVRSLSDSLGGVKIDVKTVFGAGVTINALSQTLYTTTRDQKPHILTELGITAEVVKPIEADIEKANLVSGDSNMVEEWIAEDSFDDVLVSNKSMLEGVRGVLTLLVLWDHFHDVNLNHISDVWRSDTQLFVLLSGFTTSLQLRPTRVSRSVSDMKRPWDWLSFVITRFVGVFPMLWLALLINAPRWYTHDLELVHKQENMRENDHYYKRNHEHSYKPYMVVENCLGLYVIGMQTWVAECGFYGPYDVYYASIIWNCFLIYAGGRFILDFIQKRILIRLASHKIAYAPPTVPSDDDNDPLHVSNATVSFYHSLLEIFENKMSSKILAVATVVYVLFATFLFQILKVKAIYKIK